MGNLIGRLPVISWIMWTLLKPLDWLIERLAAQQEPKDEPKKDAPQLFSHPVWLRELAGTEEHGR